MKPKLFKSCLHLFFLLLLQVICIQSSAQEYEDLRAIDILQPGGQPDEEQLAQFHQQLEQFKKNPLPINRATEQELKAAFFLNPVQIYQLIAHIKANGPLQEINELQVIPAFSLDFIREISPYISITQLSGAKPGIHHLFKQSSHELLLRHSLVLQQKKGYRLKNASSYQGDPSQILVKYKMTTASGFAVRLLLEKDAGELLLNSAYPPGIDFISGNISFTGKQKKGTLILGDYSLSFGQGLSLWTGMAFGRGADLAGMAKKDSGLSPYFSAGEQDYFRGISYKFKILDNITLTTFISSKKSDASVQESEEGIPSVSNISNSGLHRTTAELRNKDSLKEFAGGFTLQYDYRFLNIGITAYKTRYSIPFSSGDAIYRRYYFQGMDRSNAALHYNYTWRNTYAFGEIAASPAGGMAWIQGLISGWSRKVSSVLILRNYKPDHNSAYTASFGQNSDTRNEKGLYTGFNYQLKQAWLLSIYADLFSFPYARYNVDLPSSGHEYAIKLNYKPNKTSKFNFQYRSSGKEQNKASGLKTPALDQVTSWLIRMDAEYKLSKLIKLRQLADLSSYKKGTALASYGILLANDIFYKPAGLFDLNFRIAWFHIPAYENRLYRYENNVQYGASSLAYQGRGFRTYCNLTYQLSKQFKLWLRYATTWLPGSTKTGTGMEEINGPLKSEMRVQLRYNF